MFSLHYPERALNAGITGDVLVRFAVDSDGIVLEPEIHRSVEYSLDEEAIRIIMHSKKWSPAIKDGKKIKSYKAQPFKFTLPTG